MVYILLFFFIIFYSPSSPVPILQLNKSAAGPKEIAR